MSKELQVPFRGQTAAEIAASVETAVRGGKLNPGQKLPPVRVLAQTLGVSPATVAAAYQALQARGVLVAQGRRGTKVGFRPLSRPRPIAPPSVDARDLYDGNPDPTLLPPLAPFLKKIDPTPRMYGEPQDDENLVKLITRELAAEGVRGAGIGVVNGALDAIERVLAESLRPGDRVAVEDPGFGGIFDVAMSRGLSLLPMKMDAEGVLPDEMDRACRQGAQAVIVVPRAQNPTGAYLSPGRARELGKVLANFPDAVLIEDDHMNFVSGAPLHTLCDAKRPRWAHIRSFSKALNPDFRLAVISGDETTLARVRDRLVIGRRWVSHILQRTVYAMLSDAGVRRHLQKAADLYAARRQGVRLALQELGIPAFAASGFNVWIPVPEETPTVQALLAAGWAVAAGERFRINSAPAIRVTAATLEPQDGRAFAADLAAALAGAPAGAMMA